MNLKEAVAFAENAQRGMTWKKTDRPLLYHSLSVAGLVMKYGGSLEQVMAAMIHDSLNDSTTEEQIAKKFGNEVAQLAFAFMDPPVPADYPKEWAPLKSLYLQKVESLEEEALLVVMCEELHELNETVSDFKNDGNQIWDRYPVPDRDIAWYYRRLTEIAYRRLTDERYSGLVKEFSRATRFLVEAVHER